MHSQGGAKFSLPISAQGMTESRTGRGQPSWEQSHSVSMRKGYLLTLSFSPRAHYKYVTTWIPHTTEGK